MVTLGAVAALILFAVWTGWRVFRTDSMVRASFSLMLSFIAVGGVALLGTAPEFPGGTPAVFYFPEWLLRCLQPAMSRAFDDDDRLPKHGGRVRIVPSVALRCMEAVRGGPAAEAGRPGRRSRGSQEAARARVSYY